ncbi:protein draper-like [Gigantopelta aegis]|uniref:protein draper-like n=1 Tax=Gigantopelta aegis TaxID=1735272 RepID=UPI001B88A3F8|nr:protein draper-like [Gigantopelta aegis]
MFKCSDRHCKGSNSACDVHDGACKGGCQIGWKNANCTERCDGKYGPGCSSSCSARHCKADDAQCDHVTGSCDGPCDAGWQGDTCTDSCDSNHYGVNCKSLCEERHCNGEQLCHHELGYCNGGCLTGWTGLTCVEAVTGPEGNRYYIATIALAVVAAILLVLLIASVLWHFRSRNSQRNNVARQFISSTSDDRTEAEPSGLDSGSSYVNAGQSNEYEQLDVLNSPQNDYNKITGV